MSIDDSEQQEQSVRRVILIEGVANLLVLLVKISVGLSSNSLAILGDAIHSLGDVINNIVAWMVIKISSQPADEKHPYGHRKFEILAVFGLATLLVVLALELIQHALTRETVVIAHAGWGLPFMLVVLIINISLASWQNHWARKLHSSILLADSSHTVADALTTMVVILSWQLSLYGYPWLDTACALGVAFIILYLAFSLFKRVIPVLVDETAIEPEVLSNIVKTVDGVCEIRRIRSRWIGSVCAVDMIISVDSSLSTAEAHAIADAIESLLEKKYHTKDITIHIEPN